VETFKIVDSEAGKTVGFYRSHDAAQAAFLRMRRDHPSVSDSLIVVTMDEKGMPQKAERAADGHASSAAARKSRHVVKGIKQRASAIRRAAAG
jgi:hypothetical protein